MRRLSNLFSIAYLTLTGGFCKGLIASSNPPVPPAGVVERQIEQEYDVKEVPARKEIPYLEFDLPSQELDVGDATVVIYEVDISGNTSIHSRILKKNFKTVSRQTSFNERP